MRYCCRSMFGVTVGFISFSSYAGVAISSILSTIILAEVQFRIIYFEYLKLINLSAWTILLISSVMTIFAALLTIGIIKRLHKLMLPWLLLQTVIVICCCLFLTYQYYSYLNSDSCSTYHYYMRKILIAGVLGCIFNGFVLWPIYSLYDDIYKQNLRTERMKKSTTII